VNAIIERQHRLALPLRLPLPRQPLRLSDLSRAHLRGDAVAGFSGNVAPCDELCLGSGKVEPHVGLDVVLRHALAVAVREPEVALRQLVPLLGGPAEPFYCLCMVLPNAPFAHPVCEPEPSLGGGETLIGGPANPF
jgi:hypothetical protein